MNEEKLIDTVISLLNEEMATRNEDDYEINNPQWVKLQSAYEYFENISDCEEPVEIYASPCSESGGIIAYFDLFYITDEEINMFQRIVGNSSAISIEALDNGKVRLSLTIPDVHKLK